MKRVLWISTFYQIDTFYRVKRHHELRSTFGGFMRILGLFLMGLFLVSCASTRGPANHDSFNQQWQFERALQVQNASDSGRVH